MKLFTVRKWQDVVDTDFPEMAPITEQTVDDAVLNGSRFRGSVRISTGRIWTDKDFQARRERVRNTPLP